MYKFETWLKILKNKIKTWNKEVFGNIFESMYVLEGKWNNYSKGSFWKGALSI